MTAFYEGQRVQSRNDDGARGRVTQIRGHSVEVKWDAGPRLNYSPDAAATCLIPVAEREPKGDAVEHPSHYIFPGGAEVVHIAKHLPFLRGSAVKYAARAGRKHKETELEDLRKARQCLDLEIERVEAGQ